MSEPFDLEVELERLVDASDAHHVAHALRGGIAMAVHGFPRATDDIDFLMEPTQIENATRSASFVPPKSWVLSTLSSIFSR